MYILHSADRTPQTSILIEIQIARCTRKRRIPPYAGPPTGDRAINSAQPRLQILEIFMQSSTARSIIYASPSFSKLGNRISQNHKLNATTLEVTRRARIQGLAGRPLLRGDSELF